MNTEERTQVFSVAIKFFFYTYFSGTLQVRSRMFVISVVHDTLGKGSCCYMSDAFTHTSDLSNVRFALRISREEIYLGSTNASTRTQGRTVVSSVAKHSQLGTK